MIALSSVYDDHRGYLVPLNVRATKLYVILDSTLRMRIAMIRLVVLVALAFTFATGSVTALILDPQPAMACDHGH